MRKNDETFPLTLHTTLIMLWCLLVPPVSANNLALTLFDMNCREKTKGVSGGKICDIHENAFVLKAVDQPPEALFHPNMHTAHQNMRLFKLFNVRTPNVFFIKEPGGVYTIDGKNYHSDEYLSSQVIPSFVDANTLKREMVRDFYKSCRNKLFKQFVTKENFFRRTLLKKIGGEPGLARLAVSSCICDDIAPNGANWGSDGKNLVIIDADLSPESFEGYLQLALKMPLEIDISFTLITIKEMLEIYNMLSTESVKKDALCFSHLTQSETISFVTIMRTACENTLEKLSTTCSDDINHLLFQEIELQRKKYFLSQSF